MSQCAWDMSEDELKACFEKHAGDDKKLNRRELKKMMREKMQEMKESGQCKGGPKGGLKALGGPRKIMELLKDADEDKDKNLDFEEFKNFVEELKKLKDEQD